MTPEQCELLEAADKAAESAYAPYSKFSVGAAVLTDKGIFVGANIENASTNLGICAERVALAHARMHGATLIIGIAVSCMDAVHNKKDDVELTSIMPCGGCRQWMAELAPKSWLVTRGSERVFSMEELLPVPFAMQP